MKLKCWMSVLLVALPLTCLAQAGKKIEEDATAKITKQVPKIACVIQASGKQENSENKKYFKELWTQAATIAGWQVLDDVLVATAAAELGINLKTDFYSDSQGPAYLLKIGKKIGADIICYNDLMVKPGKVRRWLYNDGKADGELRVLAVDVRKSEVKSQAEWKSRKEQKNRTGLGLSVLVLGGSGYLVKSKTSAAEKGVMNNMFDDAYGDLFKSATQTGKKIGIGK